MELDYKSLREKAEDRAEEKAALMYPQGKRRNEKSKQLADEYFAQYVTPPVGLLRWHN